MAFTVTPDRNRRKIGILCATDKELSPYFSIIQNKKQTKYAMHSFYTGKIADVEVVAAYSGFKSLGKKMSLPQEKIMSEGFVKK